MEVPGVPPDAEYSLMFYKRNNAYAVRVKGGSQIMSVCRAGADKEDSFTVTHRIMRWHPAQGSRVPVIGLVAIAVA